MKHHACAWVFCAAAVMGCGDDAVGRGNLSVLLEAEDTITSGLDPGMEGESIQDGWQIRFDHYIVVIGDIQVHLSTDESASAEDGDVFAVDLTQTPASGLPLWELTELEAGDWEFNFSTPGASNATPHASVAQADFDEMAAIDATYSIAGTMTKDDQALTFRFVVPAATTFGPCEIDGVPGFSIAADSTTTVATTIHGDHIFFNGFPEGTEGGAIRLAQWLADCDLDLDGAITREELEAISPSDLSEIDDRYQLGGSPITPLDNMWQYLTAQLKTQGHFQGEGECPFK